MPGLVFENLTGACLILSGIYACLAVFTTKQLVWLHQNSPSGLNTRKFFVMTCLLTAVLRTMSFASMAFLDIETDNNDDSNANQDFFDEAFLVLFDFPDFCCISAYMLLIVVWAEAYLKSRRHWLSSFRFRKMWLLIYLVFNTLLYTVQVALYSLLFLPVVNNSIELTLIYLSLAIFNIGLPICWSAAYLYLAILVSYSICSLCLPLFLLIFSTCYFFHFSLYFSFLDFLSRPKILNFVLEPSVGWVYCGQARD